MDSPLVEHTSEPARDEEEALAEYYGWPRYWDSPPSERSAQQRGDASGSDAGDGDFCTDNSTLYRVSSVEPYVVQAVDGRAGHVSDLLIHFPDWIVRYVVVNTGRWMTGRRIILATDWITEMDWRHEQLRVDLTQAEIQQSPDVEPIMPLERAREEALHTHYRRSGYWERRNSDTT